MEHSHFIAGLLGPALVAIAIAMLTNRRALDAMAGQMPGNLAVVFLAGLLLLVTGLVVIRVHNVWSGGWPIFISIFGWMAAIGGAVRMIIPDQSAEMAAHVFNSRPMTMASALVMLAIGIYLTLAGYGVLD